MIRRIGTLFLYLLLIGAWTAGDLAFADNKKEAPSAPQNTATSDRPENDLPPLDPKLLPPANSEGGKETSADQILQYGQEILQPAETSEPEMHISPGAAPGTSAPFSLGARKSVIESEVEEQGLGQGRAKIDNQFPPLNAGVNRNMLNSGVNANALRAGTAATQDPGVKRETGLNQAQLQRLANHDLVLIIDQSGSMRTPDCPMPGVGRTAGALLNVLLGPAASISRWDWCREQTMKLAHETRYVCSRGFTVILFSVRFVVFQHVALSQVPLIFSQNVPQSDTNLTEPVTYILNDYIARRNLMRGNVKPLAIAIITDGRPNNEITLRTALIQATQYMRNPDEIKVTFFLIGNSALTGKVFIDDLERNLVRYGARYPIVRSVSFWNLEKVGLPQALADALE